MKIKITGKPRPSVGLDSNPEAWKEFVRFCYMSGERPATVLRNFILKFNRKQKRIHEKG